MTSASNHPLTTNHLTWWLTHGLGDFLVAP